MSNQPSVYNRVPDKTEIIGVMVAIAVLGVYQFLRGIGTFA